MREIRLVRTSEQRFFELSAKGELEERLYPARGEHASMRGEVVIIAHGNAIDEGTE